MLVDMFWFTGLLKPGCEVRDAARKIGLLCMRGAVLVVETGMERRKGFC